VQDRDIVAMEY